MPVVFTTVCDTDNILLYLVHANQPPLWSCK